LRVFQKIGARARFWGKLSELKKSTQNDEVGSVNICTAKSARILHKEKLDAIKLHCFYCQTSFIGWPKLVTHFRHTHRLTMLSNFVCGQQGCQRDFQSLKSFRRHILAVHFYSVDSCLDTEMTESYGSIDHELCTDVLD